jgi:rhodanese-related sulfurtransferase
VTLHTDGYGGYTITESITVKTNDPQTPDLILTLIGGVMLEPRCAVPPAGVISGFTVLIDVQSPELFATGHLIGAVNIPFEELTQWISMFPRRVRIVVYDQDGSLVGAALDRLTAEGITEACGLQGGLDGWILSYGTDLLMTFKLMPPG